MRLYLVQHAEALSKEEDPARSLSEKGVEDIRKVAAFIGNMKLTVGQILYSGKMRALQTAQILEEHISSPRGVEEADGMMPNDEPEIWFARLTEMNEDLMMAGHMPHLSRLAARLLCGNKDTDAISFEMGSVVCLERSDHGAWKVDWIIKPRLLT